VYEGERKKEEERLKRRIEGKENSRLSEGSPRSLNVASTGYRLMVQF
jgi:hypothetical protein